MSTLTAGNDDIDVTDVPLAGHIDQPTRGWMKLASFVAGAVLMVVAFGAALLLRHDAPAAPTSTAAPAASPASTPLPAVTDLVSSAVKIGPVVAQKMLPGVVASTTQPNLGAGSIQIANGDFAAGSNVTTATFSVPGATNYVGSYTINVVSNLDPQSAASMADQLKASGKTVAGASRSYMVTTSSNGMPGGDYTALSFYDPTTKIGIQIIGNGIAVDKLAALADALH